MVDHIFKYICNTAKDFVAELTPSHVQSAWAFREERVRDMGIATYCNYLSKNTYVKLIYIYICTVMYHVVSFSNDMAAIFLKPNNLMNQKKWEVQGFWS